MKKLYVLLVILLGMVGVFGCGSTGGGRKGFEYSQSPQFERDLGPEHIAALDGLGKRAGLGEAYAAKWKVDANWCAPEGYSGPLGAYTCNADCSGSPVCAHATMGYRGGYSGEAHYAGQPKTMTINHECGHLLIPAEAQDGPEVLNANNGHPTHVTIRGKVYRVKDLLEPGTRWPMPVDWIRAGVTQVGRWVNWGSDEWHEGCPEVVVFEEPEVEAE